MAGKQEATAPGGNPGPGVDFYGQPVIDPSMNVRALADEIRASLATAMKRQDDLREMAHRYDAQVGKMREAHAREMRQAARRSEERLDQKDQQLRGAESARIDAIRLVDVATQQRAAEVLATQQQALAAQVLASAEALRTAAAATAASTAETLRTTVAPMLTRLDELSRAQYETQGQKQQVVETRDVRGAGISTAMAAIVAFSVLVALVSLVYAIVHG
jgi:hypothetical protein